VVVGYPGQRNQGIKNEATTRKLASVTWRELSYDTFESGTWGNYKSGGVEAKLESRKIFNTLFASKVVRDGVIVFPSKSD
jgi:hypothetical protein